MWTDASAGYATEVLSARNVQKSNATVIATKTRGLAGQRAKAPIRPQPGFGRLVIRQCVCNRPSSCDSNSAVADQYPGPLSRRRRGASTSIELSCASVTPLSRSIGMIMVVRCMKFHLGEAALSILVEPVDMASRVVREHELTRPACSQSVATVFTRSCSGQ